MEAIWFLAKRVFAAEPDKKHAAYLKEAVAKKFTGQRHGRPQGPLSITSAARRRRAPRSTSPSPRTSCRRRPPSERSAAARRRRTTTPAVHPLRTRNSALQCDKDFGAVLGFFGAPRGWTRRKGRREKKEQQVAPVPLAHEDRFGDVTKEQFYREAMGKDMLEMGIDPNMSFLDNKRQRLPQMSEADRPRGEALLGGGARTGTQRKAIRRANPAQAAARWARARDRSSSSPRIRLSRCCSTCTTFVSFWQRRSW